MKTTKAAAHRKAIEEAKDLNKSSAADTSSSTALGISSGKKPPLGNSANNINSKKKPGPPVPSRSSRSSGASVAEITAEVAAISFTVGSNDDPGNDDYEGNKVGKSKKSVYEAEIKMVQDLDRWG